MSYLLVFTTAPSLTEARKISGILIRRKFAACVQISHPVESHYCWKGKRETSREFQLWIKTKTALYPTVERAIQENHSYEVPEIVAVPILKGSRNYLKWIDGELRK